MGAGAPPRGGRAKFATMPRDHFSVASAPLLAIIEAVIRLVPGVLGDEQSSGNDSFSGEHGLLEFAQYTRPRVFRGREVPAVLLNGNHQEIARWREENRTQRTRRRRADLFPQRDPKQ